VDLNTLLGALTAVPQLDGARCRGRSELFDPRAYFEPEAKLELRAPNFPSSWKVPAAPGRSRRRMSPMPRAGRLPPVAGRSAPQRPAVRHRRRPGHRRGHHITNNVATSRRSYGGDRMTPALRPNCAVCGRNPRAEGSARCVDCGPGRIATSGPHGPSGPEGKGVGIAATGDLGPHAVRLSFSHSGFRHRGPVPARNQQEGTQTCE